MEVIVAGYMEYDALLPALIAAYAASTTSHMLGLEKFAVNITENWNISGSRDVLILIILGVVFGLTGRFFSALLQKAKKLFGEKISNPFIRIATLATITSIAKNTAASGVWNKPPNPAAIPVMSMTGVFSFYEVCALLRVKS